VVQVAVQLASDTNTVAVQVTSGTSSYIVDLWQDMMPDLSIKASLREVSIEPLVHYFPHL